MNIAVKEYSLRYFGLHNYLKSLNNSKLYFGIIVDTFEEFSQSLKAHPSKAQILLEVNEEGATLEKAIGILKSLGVQPIDYNVLRKGSTLWVLFYLSTKDMREAALKLTEAGFTKLKGMNPLKREFTLKK